MPPRTAVEREEPTDDEPHIWSGLPWWLGPFQSDGQHVGMLLLLGVALLLTAVFWDQPESWDAHAEDNPYKVPWPLWLLLVIAIVASTCGGHLDRGKHRLRGTAIMSGSRGLRFAR